MIFLVGFPIGEASNPGPQETIDWKNDEEHLHFFLWNQGQISKYTYPLVTETIPMHGVRILPEHHLTSNSSGWLNRTNRDKGLNCELTYATSVDSSGSCMAISKLTLQRHMIAFIRETHKESCTLRYTLMCRLKCMSSMAFLVRTSLRSLL